MDREHVTLVAELLMGAAYSDGRLRGQETRVIREKLAELLGSETIPAGLEQRLRCFDPESFELDSVLARMPRLDQATARRVVEMVAAVSAADGELDLDEDDYLHAVAGGLGLPRSAYADLSLDVESRRASTEPPGPPPIPRS